MRVPPARRSVLLPVICILIATNARVPSFVVKEGERVTKDIRVERIKDSGRPRGEIGGRVVGPTASPPPAPGSTSAVATRCCKPTTS